MSRFSFEGEAFYDKAYDYSKVITAPQDAHKKLVLQIAERLTASLSGFKGGATRVDYITFSSGFKKEMKALPCVYYCLQGKGALKQ